PVAGVREPDGLRRARARLLGPPRGAAGARRRAALPRALLRLRAGRRGSDRPRAADGAAQRTADPSPPPAHHADPRDRGGAPPLLRAPLSPRRGAAPGSSRAARLALQAPLVLGQMAQAMLRPSADVVRAYRIPADVIGEAYTRN